MFRVVVFISLSVAFLILFYSLYKLITRCDAQRSDRIDKTLRKFNLNLLLYQ